MRRSVLVLACILALGAVAACGSQPTSGTKSSTGQVGASSSVPSTATLIFDWLGGNSKIIQVYPGAANTAADKVSNGTFRSGQTVPVVCKTLGRWVKSVPPEKKRRSNVWYMVQVGGKSYYATAVYADVHGNANWCPGM